METLPASGVGAIWRTALNLWNRFNRAPMTPGCYGQTNAVGKKGRSPTGAGPVEAASYI